MPQELPGLYYDPEKKRYFPVKGRIPGTSSRPPLPPPDQENDQQSSYKRRRIGTAKLLQVRELCGKVLSYNRWTCNFQHEFQDIQASQPMVWKYQNMDGIVDSALEYFEANIQTLEGQMKTDFLMMGSMRGSLSLYEVGGMGKHFDYGVKCISDRIWPLVTESRAECSRERRAECTRTSRHIWRPRVPVIMPTISCIKRNRKLSGTDDSGSDVQHALVTTLGSETSGGTVYVLKLDEPLNLSRRRISEVAPLHCTIWTADYNPNRFEAVVGTNVGARLVNLETKNVSWLCRSKSDVLSLQFNQSGNAVICGHRNGVISTVDVRQKEERFPDGLVGQRAPHVAVDCLVRGAPYPAKKRFKLRENISPSQTVSMPSSVSSLISLETYDEYFLASSMDGSIKLYDHRMMQRGAVQSYQGQVNSHTRIQLGVDSSERFLVSGTYVTLHCFFLCVPLVVVLSDLLGGEDGKVRMWSIKTGELLFVTKVSNYAPTSVCWPTTSAALSQGAWLGGVEGLFYVDDTGV